VVGVRVVRSRGAGGAGDGGAVHVWGGVFGSVELDGRVGDAAVAGS
jgi:hypothetical protein